MKGTAGPDTAQTRRRASTLQPRQHPGSPSLKREWYAWRRNSPPHTRFSKSKVTFHGRQRPTPGHQQPRKTPARALSEGEREQVSRKESRTFRAIHRQHPAVESMIDNLEQRGMDRILSCGADGLARMVALSIMTFNVHRIGLLLKQARTRRRRANRKFRGQVSRSYRFRAGTSYMDNEASGRDSRKFVGEMIICKERVAVHIHRKTATPRLTGTE